MVKAFRDNGVDVLYVTDLLGGKDAAIRKYLQRQFKKAASKIQRLDLHIKGAIAEAQEMMTSSPVDGLLLGLESGKRFSQLPYETRLEVYAKLGTLMPQTSLYYTQDPVISSPKGLIKSKMSMPIRRQEPDIVEIALGSEHYIHRMRNMAEGGDVTMWSYRQKNGSMAERTMLFGINRLSGRSIGEEINYLKGRFGVGGIVEFYAPDFFHPSEGYQTGNVEHDDTIKMPIDEGELLANIRLLKGSHVIDNIDKGKHFIGYEWVKRNRFEIVEVPDEEQLRWGTNAVPLGKRKVYSADDLDKTNGNLVKAGFSVVATKLTALKRGFGSAHCMTAYLR